MRADRSKDFMKMQLPDSYLDLTLRSVLALYGKPRKGDKNPVAVAAIVAAVNTMAKRTAAEDKAREREQRKLEGFTTSPGPAKKARKKVMKKKPRKK
jgi:hypothetical protein